MRSRTGNIRTKANKQLERHGGAEQGPQASKGFPVVVQKCIQGLRYNSNRYAREGS